MSPIHIRIGNKITWCYQYRGQSMPVRQTNIISGALYYFSYLQNRHTIDCQSRSCAGTGYCWINCCSTCPRASMCCGCSDSVSSRWLTDFLAAVFQKLIGCSATACCCASECYACCTFNSCICRTSCQGWCLG